MSAIQVSLHDRCIVRWEVGPDATSSDIDHGFEQAASLSAQIGSAFLLLDLTRVGRFSSSARDRLQRRLANLPDEFEHLAVCTGANPVVHVAVRFALSGLNLRSHSLHETHQEALEELLGRRNAAPSRVDLAKLVVDQLIAMSSGSCAIDDDAVAAESDPAMQQILAALLCAKENIVGHLLFADEEPPKLDTVAVASENPAFDNQQDREQPSQDALDSYAGFFESAPLMFATVALPASHIVRCNDAFATALGFEPHDLVGRTLFELCQDSCGEATQQAMRELAQSATLSGAQIEFTHRDGRMRNLCVNATPVHDALRGLKGCRLVAQDRDDLAALFGQPAEPACERHCHNPSEVEELACMAAHDLQEPLRRIQTYADVLQQAGLEKLDNGARRHLSHIAESATSMQRLVKGLLDYARAGQQGEPLVPVHASEALRHALENLSVVIEETGSQVRCGELPRVMGDEMQLVQLFQNLVINAIRYGKLVSAETEVSITAQRSGEFWEFAVADNGVGMSPEQQQRIFELFGRPNAPREAIAGGLGLTIAKRVLDRHGGRIWIESKPDEGTTVRFTLPSLDKSGIDSEAPPSRLGSGEEHPAASAAFRRLKMDLQGNPDLSLNQ